MWLLNITGRNRDNHSLKKIDDQKEDAEAKRQRLDDTPADLATENGHQQRDNDPEEVGVQSVVENLTPAEDEHQQAVVEETGLTKEAPKQVNDEELAAEDKQTDVAEHTADDDIKLENAEEKASEGEPKKHPEELDTPAGYGSQQKVAASAQNEDTSVAKSMSRKMEVPNRQIIRLEYLLVRPEIQLGSSNTILVQGFRLQGMPMSILILAPDLLN